MIRRPAGDQFWLITQHDHARVAGVIASCIGGDRFALPEPREAVLNAISWHNAGWRLHDDEPTLNDQGQPLNVFEIAMSLACKVWSASVESARGYGPYAGLLVSIHKLNLSHLALQPAGAPHERARSQGDKFTLNKFQHQQVEMQEALRNELQMRNDIPLQFGLASPGTNAAEDALIYNYSVLSLCNRLSLQLCVGQPLFPEMNDITNAPGVGPVQIRTRMSDNHTIEIDPWPFGTGPFDVKFPYRAVPARKFSDDAAFRAAYKKAPVAKMPLSLRPM